MNLAKGWGRALGSIISKLRTLKEFGIKTYKTLYNYCFVPIFDYQSSFWYYKEYSNIESVQNRSIRYFPCVHRLAPKLAINGDVGWMTTRERRWYIMVQYWNRLVNIITKTCLCNVDPLKPHFHIVKLRFTGVYIILFLLKNIDCGYLLEPPRRVPTIYVLSRHMKNIRFFVSEFFQFLEVKVSIYLNRRVFLMWTTIAIEKKVFLWDYMIWLNNWSAEVKDIMAKIGLIIRNFKPL